MSDDDALLLARARIGVVLRGKYTLERVLGVGGMASVYEAVHRNRKRFAIKMLHPEISSREGLRTRFLREGYVANSVMHTGAVAVLDDDIAEDGSAFLVMELLEGAPVDAIAAAQGGHLSLSMTLSIGEALLDVLASAHEHGIVHRDLKPANLFVTNDGELKVLDFGIARLRDDTAIGATATGAMLGTPAFMAPEQALGMTEEIDAQTDLWAVGATLFSLLGGTLVHEGQNAQQLLVSAATKPARSLSSVASEVPQAITAVIDQALGFDKKDRWRSAKDMREALQNASVEALGTPIRPLAKSERTPPSAKAGSPSANSAPTDFGGATQLGGASGAPRGRVRVRSEAATPALTTSAAVVARTDIPSSEGAAVRAPRRVPWRAVLGGAAVCALLAGGVAMYRAAHAPRLRHCALVVDMRDGPRCALELPATALSRRSEDTFRMTELGGRVVALELVNFAGNRIGRDGTRAEIKRADDGAVREIVARDAHENVVEWQKWSEGGQRVDFVDIDGTTPRRRGESHVTTIKRELDGAGLVVRETYLGASGRPRADEDGAYGRAFVNGRRGRPIRVTILAADGKPGADASGRGIIQRTDDDTPDGAESRVFDVDGKPMTVLGVHCVKATWTDAMALSEWLDFGVHDERVVSLDPVVHTHGKRITWNPESRTREVTWVDETGHTRPERSDAFSKFRETADARGRAVLVEFLDGDGNAVMRHGDSATIRASWNEHDDQVETASFDAAGRPMVAANGYAKQVMVYDERGRYIERRSYDESGKLAARSKLEEGSAIQRVKYDERGLAVALSAFDPDGQPSSKNDGVSVELRKYDRFRNLTEVTYLGIDGQPIGGQDGLAGKREVFDDNDDRVSEELLDAASLPLALDGDYAARRMKYDERGLLVEERYLDPHGDPMLRRDGYAVARFKRDRHGDVVEETYLGKHEEPVMRAGGYASKRLTYDVQRRRVDAALFDLAGKPVVGSDGWSIERDIRDERGLPTREDHLDAGGHPVLTTQGSASLVKTWDARGNLVDETTLGVDGKPIATSDGYATKKSVYTKKSTYDEPDDVVEESLFGAGGKPAAGSAGWSVRKLRYDDVGNLIEEAFFDGEHHPVAPRDAAYASTRSRFDARQRLIEASYLDASGAPAKGPEGVETVRYQRDTYGRAVETTYIDGSGMAAPSSEGKVVVRTKFDDRGRLAEELFVGTDGAPRLAKDGCAGHRLRYDAQGHKSEESCLGAKEGMVVSTEGWAIRRTLRDGRGNAVEVSSYGADGALRADKDGVARRRTRFDERNLALESAVFDANDRPAHDKQGISVRRYGYDESGKQIASTALDEHGKTITPR
jgi:serine/threonine protein kinase